MGPHLTGNTLFRNGTSWPMEKQYFTRHLFLFLISLILSCWWNFNIAYWASSSLLHKMEEECQWKELYFPSCYQNTCSQAEVPAQWMFRSSAGHTWGRQLNLMKWVAIKTLSTTYITASTNIFRLSTETDLDSDISTLLAHKCHTFMAIHHLANSASSGTFLTAWCTE